MDIWNDAEIVTPPFAPPILKHGKRVIAQTANILLYLGDRHGLAPKSEWTFRSGARRIAVPIESFYVCNQADSAIQACVHGNGLGVFLSYMVAPAKRARQLRYVLQDFELEPLPVHVVYPRSRALSANVRAFVDFCVPRLRQEKLG